MIERQRRRLQRAFGAILVAAGAPSAFVACGHGDAAPGGAQPGGRDEAPDASADSDARADVGHPDVTCTLAVTVLDAGADVEERCRYVFNCGLPVNVVALGCTLALADSNGQPVDGGIMPCQLVEGQGCTDGGYDDAADGGATFECFPCLGPTGRRPVGLRVQSRRRAAAQARFERAVFGAYFARAAHDEAASIAAFERMRDEMEMHGSPRSMVREAERAARDERGHARAMERWAKSFGAARRAPRIDPPRRRGLEAMARENAVEGCVRETYGALVATWQAAHARNRSMAATFARIAADETRHAALAWSFAAWAEARLSPKARARIDGARARALDDLRRAAGFEPSRAFVSDLGLPTARVARALVDGLARELGSPSSR